MRKLINKLSPVLSLLFLVLVIIKVPAPNSWKEASIFQILIFIIPILMSLVLLLRIFLKNLTISFLLGLSLLMLLVLKIVDMLNSFSILVVLSVCIGLIMYLHKPKLNLNFRRKMPGKEEDLKPIKSLNKRLKR